MARFRRDANRDDDPALRFGNTCPVCGQRLGKEAPPIDPETGRFAVPPSFRLEIGTPDVEGTPWRVTELTDTYPVAESVEPVFNEHEIDFVYLLCGGGHIFPDATPVFLAGGVQRPEQARQKVDDWNMVAAMGGPASGKTYLLVRMLQQDLDNFSNWSAADDPGRVRIRKLSPLEELPLARRTKQYNETRAAGIAITPTGTDALATPAGILDDALPDALAAIREMIRRVVLDGERRARTWGRTFRQPLILRTDSRGRRAWNGVADLPGELFDEDGTTRREAGMLRAFDGLLWVVDPVVAPTTLDWMVDDNASEMDRWQLLDGSLRPGTIESYGVDVIRVNRESIQDDIGRQVTMVDGLFAVDEGHQLQMLVAINKCDLISAALGDPEFSLCNIGAAGSVLRGTASFLAFTMDRWARETIGADRPASQLLGYLRGGTNTDPEVRRERSLQVAAGLLSHYSDQHEFWKLVHLGTESHVTVHSGAHIGLPRQQFRVPSIEEHLTSALEAGSGNVILFRDLVMSAIGCGLAYGLGQEAALFRMQREQWMTLRFFVCSPLGTVPIGVNSVALQPRDPGKKFPKVDERSAALTQLLLAVLGRART